MVKRAQGEITAGPIRIMRRTGIRDWGVAVGKPIVTAGSFRHLSPAAIASTYAVMSVVQMRFWDHGGAGLFTLLLIGFPMALMLVLIRRAWHLPLGR